MASRDPLRFVAEQSGTAIRVCGHLDLQDGARRPPAQHGVAVPHAFRTRTPHTPGPPVSHPGQLGTNGEPGRNGERQEVPHRRDTPHPPATSREIRNERILHTFLGAKARVGDKVLMRESAITLYRDGVHPKLAPDQFAGPWSVERVVREGLSFSVRLHGRQVRQRTVSATEMRPFHSRPKEIRNEFEDEFAQLVGVAAGFGTRPRFGRCFPPLRHHLPSRGKTRGGVIGVDLGVPGGGIRTAWSHFCSQTTKRGTASRRCSWTSFVPGRVFTTETTCRTARSAHQEHHPVENKIHRGGSPAPLPQGNFSGQRIRRRRGKHQGLPREGLRLQ